MKFSTSNISGVANAFTMRTVGTKVNDAPAFMVALEAAVSGYTFPANGQGFVSLPESAFPFVSCGIAPRKALPLTAYVAREHRGEVILCASRLYAGKVASLNVVVYTADAYKVTAQVTAEEAARITSEGADFVIVAILAGCGDPKPPVSSHRFTRNLAGGNERYSPDNGYTLGQAIQEAQEISAYENDWITVAD